MQVNLKKKIEDAIREEAGSDRKFSVERQETSGRGDYSSNIAFALAKKLGRPPLSIAEELAIKIYDKNQDIFYAIEVAPPGFLNFFLAHHFLDQAIQDFLSVKKSKKKGRASIEFISANPTGPLHIGNARGGPIGDTVANILEETGWNVTREYFHNDAGAQVEKFAESLWYWYLRARRVNGELPKDGYEGEYVKRIGIEANTKWRGALLKNPAKGKKQLMDMAFKQFWGENFATIKKLGIRFDKITKESTFTKSKTKQVIGELQKKKLLTQKDGALWYTPHDEFLKDRETVVVKADGTPLYFANDIAYHKEKFAKNDFVIDILGEGHEGHIPKLKSVAKTFGFPQDHFHVIVHGQVNLLKNGKVVTMSKRKGNFVTAEEVLREVGKDAFRFFMLQYSPRSGMQFDISLAKKRAKQNPVYYVQYAHARAAGILRKSKKKADLKKIDWRLLESLPEMALLKYILAYGEMLEETAHDFEVGRLTRYAYELARTFTYFYETTPVIGEKKELECARLGLVMLTKNTLAKVLKLLGISAPEKM